MILKYRDKYKKLSDTEIVDKIINKEKHDEEAAVYLIYERYRPLCVSICIKLFGNIDRLDELQSELYMLLKGKKQDWAALRSFQWRSTFGRWLSITVYNLFIEIRKELIENDGKNSSIDNEWYKEDNLPKKIDIPVDEETQRERQYRILRLQEAINMLDNPDKKFVVIKRLQGYSSKEVAKMLQSYWDTNNIVRYNNKKQIVKPNSGYIDNLFKRGFDNVVVLYKFLSK